MKLRYHTNNESKPITNKNIRYSRIFAIGEVAPQRRGFTTVDLLAGLMVITIIIISLYLALGLSTRIQTQAKHVTIATAEAEKVIEAQRAKRFTDLTNGTTNSTISSLPTGTISVTISNVVTNLKKISTTVSWQVGDNTKSVTLETLAAKGGLNDVTP